MRHNLAKEKLAAGKPISVVAPGYTSAGLVELLGRQGFDAIFIDCEHGPAGWDEVENMVRAAELTNVTPIVRVQSNDASTITRALDRGAGGVQVPHINTRAEAEAAVRSAKFAPLGHRGYSGGRSAFGVAGNFTVHANAETMVIAMLEEAEALKNLDDILKVDQIDAFFIAPGDLSQSMGFPGQLNHPRGMAVGPDGSLYVIDSQNARVSIFDPQGKFVTTFGTPSTTDPNSQAVPPGGTFREPWGIAVGQDGKIYVADTWNHRVQVFDSKGTLLKMWGVYEQLPPGQPGKPDGFWGPRDIAVDNQSNVYVADTGNKRIRVFDSNGKYLHDIGQGGAGVGQLNEPVGLAINPETNELFVADTWNRRIEVYALDGTYRRSWNLQAWAGTTDSGNRPYLALDRTDTHLFVTDPDTARVLVFDLNGSPVLSFGSLGSGTSFSASQFGVLGGITVDPSNRLFLADTQTGRVLRFSLDTLPGLIPAPAQNNSQEQPGQSGSPENGTPPATSDVF